MNVWYILCVCTSFSTPLTFFHYNARWLANCKLTALQFLKLEAKLKLSIIELTSIVGCELQHCYDETGADDPLPVWFLSRALWPEITSGNC